MESKIDPDSKDADVLMGWKAIAAYLGKSVRSVQRWERDLGLPTHRIMTMEGSIAYARRSEVDRWLIARDRSDTTETAPGGARGPSEKATSDSGLGVGATPPLLTVPAKRFSQKWLWLGAFGAAAVISLGGAAFTLLMPTRETPAAFVLVGRSLEGRDHRGRVLWSHDFGSEVSRAVGTYQVEEPRGSDSVARVDLNGDGVLATLIPVHFGRDGESHTLESLYAFSDDGRVLWSVSGDLKLSCGQKTFSAPWSISWVTVSGGPGPRRVWVAYRHHTWWPSFVVEISPTGSQTIRYVQTGWIMSLQEWHTPRGVRLVAGGVMNEHARASVAMFDPSGPPVMSPYVDAQFDCEDAPTASPDRVILFPALEVSQGLGSPYVMVQRMNEIGPDLRLEINSGSVLAVVNADDRVRDLSFSDAYWLHHRALEVSGKLSHSVEACPERTRPAQIRSWTMAKSWQTYSIPTEPGRVSSR